MVLRSKSVGDKDVADQRGTFVSVGDFFFFFSVEEARILLTRPSLRLYHTEPMMVPV